MHLCTDFINLDPVHTGPDPYGHNINLKSLKTSMTLKFVIILQNLAKAYHRKGGKSKYDRKLTELDIGTTRIRSRVNGVLFSIKSVKSKPTGPRILLKAYKSSNNWWFRLYFVSII